MKSFFKCNAGRYGRAHERGRSFRGHVVAFRRMQEWLGDCSNRAVSRMPQRLKEIGEHRENAVILVCQTHKRSKTAAEHLTKAGFSNIQILRGGMEAWHRVTDRK